MGILWAHTGAIDCIMILWYPNAVLVPRDLYYACVHVVSLTSEEDTQQVDRNAQKRNMSVWYEAYVQTDKAGRTRKVYCYISPRVSSGITASTDTHVAEYCLWYGKAYTGRLVACFSG